MNTLNTIFFQIMKGYLVENIWNRIYFISALSFSFLRRSLIVITHSFLKYRILFINKLKSAPTLQPLRALAKYLTSFCMSSEGCPRFNCQIETACPSPTVPRGGSIFRNNVSAINIHDFASHKLK